MIKRILLVLLSVLFLFIISYNLHSFLLDGDLGFSLFNVYFFHAFFLVFIYICIEIVSDKLPNQAGYAYLMLMCFKIGLFLLVFQSSVFSIEELSQVQRIALVAPLFVFLIAEATAVAKLLNSK